MYVAPALCCQVAMPYDWRLPIPVMESRDGFFTRLKNEIEIQHVSKLPLDSTYMQCSLQVSSCVLAWC